MTLGKNHERYIIVHRQNGYWIGYAYNPRWCDVALPRLTEIDALIAALTIIQGCFNDEL
jgi:hypothetical protein